MSPRLTTLLTRYPPLQSCAPDITAAYEVLKKTFAAGGKLLLCGNGGSAADSDHIAGELLKGFGHARTLPKADAKKLGGDLAKNLQGALPAIPLPQLTALVSAFGNDCDPKYVYAQLTWGLGRKGDALLAITTSGNSANVLHAADAAKARGMKVIGLTGTTGGKLLEKCDVCIRVPEKETFKIQEFHLPVYHCLCLMLEEEFFGKGAISGHR
jgi:D-sedoheptulose 7-phosphate isomerase